MRHKIAAGLGAGLIAGRVLAVVMRVVPVSAANGREIHRGQGCAAATARVTWAGLHLVGAR
jgi:hypothetical protein